MAHKTYNTLWREVMQTLIHLLEMETTPPSPSPSPSLSSTTTTTSTSLSRPSTATKPSTTSPASNPTTTGPKARTWGSARDAYEHYGRLYLGYQSVVRGLEDCYDQMAHPQKRKSVLLALLPVLGRLLEIHDCLVCFSEREISMDGVLQSMGVTASALQQAVPRFFKEERARELEERDKLLTALLAQYTVKLEADGRPGHSLEVLDTPAAHMSLEDAVRIIQVNERGRQGRKKCQEAREARSRDRVLMAPPAMEPDVAAVLIQKTFRGHLTRKKTKAAREDELVFLGMKASNKKKDVDLVEKAEATRARRKLIQNQNELEYQQAIQQMRQTILDQEGPDIKEQMQDDVRKFFLTHKEQLGKFPVFPSEQEGGSAKMLNPLMKVPASPSKTAAKPPPPTSPKTAAKGTRPTTGSKTSTSTSKPLAKTPSSSKPAPPTAKSGISRPVAKGTKKEPGSTSSNSFTPTIPPSNFLPDIHSAAQEYLSVWAERDEEANFAQKHDIDLVRETLRPQIEAEIRKQVDEQLREELENLKNAVEKKKQKKKGKKKKGDAKSSEPKKEKKEKKEKKKKGRKGPKDPTADRSIQSLYAELVSMNIVINCPSAHSKLTDFVGVYCPNSPPDTPSPPPPDQSRPPPHVPPAHPSLFGVLQAIMNLCILPLGSPSSVSSNLPPPLVPRSLLLVAPPCYGKSMLCNIIANETGSVLLNLDPINLVNANTSRSVSLVVHMAFKVAKAMSPSVIYIDNVEQIFVKPKKKQKAAEKSKGEGEGEAPVEETKPLGVAEIATLMRKELVSQINALQPGDRVLVIGMTKQPWVGTMGGSGMGFDRQLIIPAPDPASLTLLWSKLVQDHSRDLAPGENLILASLAQSLPPGLVQRVVEASIKGNVDKRPLQGQDFVGHMAKLPAGQELKGERAQLASWWHSNKRGPARLLALVDPNAPTDPSSSSAPSRTSAKAKASSKPAAKPAAKK